MTCLCSRWSTALLAAHPAFEPGIISRSYSKRALKLIEKHKKAPPPPKKKSRKPSRSRALKRNAKDSGKPSSAGLNGSQSEKFWRSDWGEDKLKPPSSSKNAPAAGDRTRPPILYTRRVEGLLNKGDGPVLQDLEPLSGPRPIAQLAHNLDRVLFSPGVHWLKDPRSHVYNFTPWLETIPKVTNFAFERLQGFVKSSRDQELRELAARERRPFAGSTSSLTGMLSQVYFLLSQNKSVHTDTLSSAFRNEPTDFTPGQRMPVSVIFNYNHKDGTYAIDSDSDPAESEKNILTWMGTLLEKLLTTPPDIFTRYLRDSPPPLIPEAPQREAYRYAKSKRFVMRSQLDCQDTRLPGTGVFDIKTRACLPIRLDILNFEENSGYLIRSQHGFAESFEREYYDLIRSAFLKYSFQARIGNMDGVFVAYHNTARMFGFQYVPLEEMDKALFGPKPGTGDRVFEKCVQILECVAEEIVRCFPKQSVRCTFETEDNSTVMNVWVEPATWDSAAPRPIHQLSVKTVNYFGQEYRDGVTAILEGADEDWLVRWSVVWLCAPEDEMRQALAEAKERQFRAYNYPAGVGPDEMPAFWDNLNFGSKTQIQSFENSLKDINDSIPISSYRPENFKKASNFVRALRKFSREGRKTLEMMEKEEAGKPKVVLGSTEPYVYEPTLCTTSETTLSEPLRDEAKVSDIPVEDILVLTIDATHDATPPLSASNEPAQHA